MPQQKPLFSIGIIADAQYCDHEPMHGRFYRKSTEKLSEALQTLNRQQVAFFLDMGDLIDRDFSSFTPIKKAYKLAQARVYRVLGNHDFSVQEEEKPKVAGQLGLDPLAYYDFTYLGWRFIMLNGNEVSTFAHPADSPEAKEGQAMLEKLQQQNAVNAKPWNAGMSQQQMQWLESRLNEAAKQNQKTIIVNHFPVYPKDPHNLWNDDEVLALLLKYPQVVAYFNGHHHAGNYGRKEHVHFLNFKGMVETEDENAFALVEVYQDHLQVNGYGREESRRLEIG
ncbi:MAG: metallophosphoesterase [Cyclobacteriaceae bacterium]